MRYSIRLAAAQIARDNARDYLIRAVMTGQKNLIADAERRLARARSTLDTEVKNLLKTA